MSIPDDVRRFVLANIPSIPSLEAALLLRRTPATALSVQEAAAALYVPERTAFEALKALLMAGLLQAEGERFRYAPRTAALLEAMDRLADTYARDLVAVTHLIHGSTRHNAQRFADAFKLRKDT